MTQTKTPPDTHSAATGTTAPEKIAPKQAEAEAATPAPREIGGPKGPEPTRFGDWERNGRCSDF